MLVIPAIDIRGGRCVRLIRGDFSREISYSDSPRKAAEQWLACGARRLHIVDLDGAKQGRAVNRGIIGEILKIAGKRAEVQIGGGIRDLQTARDYLDDGASFVILGTAAIENPDFLRAACAELPQKILLSLDAEQGRLKVRGWIDDAKQSAAALAKTLSQQSASPAGLIYTDIARDGMLGGANIAAAAAVAKAAKLPVIAGGGVRYLADIDAANAADGVIGVIAGRALYDGELDLRDALARAAQKAA